MAKKLPTIITEEELWKILKDKKVKKHHKVAYALGFYAGLRISEIVGLGKEESACHRAPIMKEKIKREIDGKNIVHRKCTRCLKELKSSDIRRSITSWQISPLMPRDIENDFIKIKDAKGGKDRDVPIHKNLRKYLKHLPVHCKTRSLQFAFGRVTRRILNKELHFHCLRHSGATFCLNVMGWDLKFVQQFLGHSDINTTEKYTHVNPKDLLEKMRETE